MDDERLHQIIEDDLCEQCDELAMPYDSYWDIPYCATHAMEYLADVALEDYTEASAELADQAMLVHLTHRAVVDSAECCRLPRQGHVPAGTTGVVLCHLQCLHPPCRDGVDAA